MAYDDDELPDNLFDAVATAAEATEQAISAGSLGNLVELRIPELWDPISGNVMAEAGDQLKVWEITEYVSQLCPARRSRPARQGGLPRRRLRRPPQGEVAGRPFHHRLLNDRKLYEEEDAVLVFAAPDPPSLEAVTKTTKIANENGAAVVLINPRLASGDAGIGLTVRRMREEFLGRMTVVYCIQPLPWCNGNIFKRFPGMWLLYLQDEARPGRFKLVQESAKRLAGDDLDDVVMKELRLRVRTERRWRRDRWRRFSDSSRRCSGRQLAQIIHHPRRATPRARPNPPPPPHITRVPPRAVAPP